MHRIYALLILASSLIFNNNIQACSGTQYLTSCSGSIGTGPYTPNQQCIWKVVIPGAQNIDFTFNGISLNNNDYVKVYLGNNISGTATLQFTGTINPSPFSLNGDTITFVFQADGTNDITFTGFSINYQCSYVYADMCYSYLNPACDGEDFISNVTIGNTTLNNSSTCRDTAINFTKFDPVGNQTAQLIKGNIYPLKVTSTKVSSISCWIDYNANNHFESNEWNQVTTTSTAGVPSTVNILIPSTAATGLVRMRIRTRGLYESNSFNDACSEFGSGETEDYFVNFIGSSSNPIANFYSNKTQITTNESVNFFNSSSGSPTSFNWTFQGGTPSTSTSQNPSNIVYTIPGDYPVALTVSNGNSNTLTSTSYIHVENGVYCTTGINAACNANDKITRVKILNTSLSNTSSCSGLQAYTSFVINDSTSTVLHKGGTYTLSVVSSATSKISCWIDYNKNQVFENSEWLQVTATSTPNVASTVNFTVPNTALEGNLKMRIRSSSVSQTNGADNACTYFATGETEDYELVVITYNATSTAYCNPSTGTGLINEAYIDDVIFGTLSNIGSGPGDSSLYKDYTSISGNVNAGQNTLTLNFHVKQYTYALVTVYIDTNNDGIFDNPTELVYNTNYFANYVAGFASGTITIPSNLNTCRMRVMVMSYWTTLTIPSCFNIAYNGEVEDYTIKFNGGGTPPTPNFTATPINVTTSHSVNFTDNSTNAPSSYHWFFEGGTPDTSSAQNPTGIFYNTPGCYKVTQVVSNNSGSNSKIKNCYINVSNSTTVPIADFNSNTSDITMEDSVNFSDASTNNPTSWLWSFPGGIPSSSTQQNPSNIRYDNPGCYDVTLKTYNAFGGDTLTKSCKIHVVNYEYCMPSHFSLAQNTFGRFINGVTLNTLSNTNSGSATGPHYTNYGASATTLTAGNSYTISINRGGTANKFAAWIDYNHDGDFEDTGEKIASPSINTTGGTSNVTFTIPSSAAVGKTKLRVMGMYSLLSVVLLPCDNYQGEIEDYTVTIINNLSPPIAQFTANNTNIATGGSVNFTDLSSGSPTSWSWTFQGATPSTSTLQNPTNIIYPANGCYEVSLTTTNGNGSNTITQTCYINVSQAVITYCIPNPTNGTGSGDYLNSVSLNTLSNLNTGSTTGPNYTYYTNLSTTLNAGTNYTLIIGTGTYAGDTYAAWIDYNGDGDFLDADEKLGQISIGANINGTINFTIPASVLPGNVRLRVRCADNNGAIANMDACTSYLYGETEDYKIILTSTNPPIASFTLSSAIICANTQVSINNNSIGATSYSWTFQGGTPATSTLQNPTVSWNTNGTKTITLVATNANGSNTATQNITVLQAPTAVTITANGSTSICPGNSVVLTGNSGGSWSNGSTAASITVNQSGSFSVTTSNSCGSITSNAIAVTVNPLPTASTISAMGATTFCSGGSVMLMGNSGGTWSNGSTAASITVSTAGVYTVTNTNACGTATSNSITVTVTQAPTAAVISAMGATTFCEGNSLMLMGNNGGTWSNGSTAASIFVNQTGTYSVTTSNSCGSTTSNAITVTVNPLPTASTISAMGATTFCSGGSVMLMGNSGGTWSNGSTAASITVSTAGVYTVTNTNACGTTTSNSITVIVTQAPTAAVISAMGATTFCEGNSLMLMGNNGGTWSNGSTAASIFVNQTGTYSVTTSNSCGSATSNAITVTVNPLPTASTISAMGSTSFCNGESVMLMGNNGGTWSNGSTAADITVSTAGVYSVTTTNTCGTTTSNSITVTVTQAPTAAVISAMGATTFCEGNSLMLMGNNGGTWSNGSTAASIFVNQTGTYSVTTSNSCGSTTSNAITVTVNPLPTAPTISAMGATTFCSGGSVMLMGNSGGTWSNGSNAASITVSTAGVYNVTNTNACGTTTSNSITVTVTQAPTAAVISAMGATTFCEGNSLMLMGNNGGTWSNGSTAASIFVNQSGTYSVTTSNSCGSTTSNSISVTVNPGPTASLITASGPTNFCEGGSVTLVGNTTGVWSTGANSATLNVTQSGSYFVSSINACGATTSNTIVVNVQSLPTASVITANGSINICSGSTINLSGNNGGVWSTGSSASSIDVSQAGNYSVTTTNACGSTTSNSIDITVINVDTSVTVGSASLLANATNASYQWLLCNGLYSVIAGETNQTFQPTMFTAFYAVAVSQNGCSDTSSCHYFMFTDLASIHPNTNAGISIYPNPATNTIVMGGVHHQDVKIINNLGETVLLYNNYNDQQRIDVSSLSSGIYFVKSNNYLTKFIKQ